MSAFGPKRTFHYVTFDVAFGGKADIPCCSAYVRFDPKRTFGRRSMASAEINPKLPVRWFSAVWCLVLSLRVEHATASIHRLDWRSSCMAGASLRAAAERSGNWVCERPLA